MNLDTQQIFISRDVVFYEDIFPLKTSTNTSNISSPSVLPVSTGYFDDLYPISSNSLDINEAVAPTFSEDIAPADHAANTATVPLPSAVRRSSRPRSTPTYLADYDCSGTSPHTNAIHTSPHTLDKVFIYDRLSQKHCTFALAMDHIKEPHSYTEAIQHQCWRDAYKAEIDALEANDTWEIVDLPPGKYPIGCKIVYRIKFLPNGDIERYKIQIVAKGYTQQEGVNFLDTFSPVAKMTSI